MANPLTIPEGWGRLVARQIVGNPSIRSAIRAFPRMPSVNTSTCATINHAHKRPVEEKKFIFYVFVNLSLIVIKVGGIQAGRQEFLDREVF